MVTTTPTASTTDAATWVAGFAEGWRAPTDADSFCDHFDPMLADDITLIQPQLPRLEGKRAFRERFARPLFSLLSTVRGTVGSWAATEAEDGSTIVFIELTITGRLAGGRRATLETIDRIVLRDGLAVERDARLDPVELLGAVALSPLSWPAFARLQLARFGKGTGA